MAHTVVEHGPRSLLNFVVYSHKPEMYKITEILRANQRKYEFELPTSLSLWKITIKCTVLQAKIVWELIGHLTTEKRK